MHEESRAREIYFNSLGSRFFMLKAGVLGEYRAFNISGEQEAEWRRELIEDMAMSLDNEELDRLDKLVSIAGYHGDSIVLEAVLNYIVGNLHTMDAYVQMVYAEHLWAMAGSASQEMPGGPYSQARSMVIRIWHNIASGIVRLAEGNASKLETDGENAEEFIKKWAERRLTAAGAGK